MPSPLEWAIKFKNEMSGPIGGAVASLRDLGKELRQAQSAAATFDASAGRFRDASTGQFTAAPSAMGSAFEAAMGPLGAAKAGIEEVGTVAMGIATKVYDVGASFTIAAVKAADFHEKAMMTFQTLTGSAAEAKGLIASAMDFSDKSPFDPKTIMQGYQRLAAGGFKPIEIPIMMKAAGDLATLKGMDPAVIGRVTENFSRINAVGHLTTRSIQQFAAMGVNAGAVYDTLAEKLKKPRSEVEKLVKAGKVNGDTGIDSILDTMKKTISGGEIGGLMDKQSSTLTGLMSTLRGRPLQLLMELDGSPAYKNIKGILSNLVDALGPSSPSGTALKQAMGNLFGAMFGGLGSLAGKKGAGVISGIVTVVASGINTVGNLMRAVRPYVAAFAGGFGGAFLEMARGLMHVGSSMMAVLGPMMGAKTSGHAAADAFRAIGSALAYAIGFFVVVAGAVGGFGMAITGAAYAVVSGVVLIVGAVASAAAGLVSNLGGVMAYLEGLGASAVSVGTNIIAGIVQGLVNGRAWIVQAVSSLGDTIIDTVQSVLKINSPSKVMAGLGVSVPEGFAMGIDDGAGEVEAAMRTMVDPPKPRGAVVGGNAGGGGRSGGITINMPITINMQGQGDKDAASSLAQEITRRVRLELEHIVDEFGLGPVPVAS